MYRHKFQRRERRWEITLEITETIGGTEDNTTPKNDVVDLSPYYGKYPGIKTGLKCANVVMTVVGFIAAIITLYSFVWG